MNALAVYGAAAVLVMSAGLFGLITQRDTLRRLLALNVLGAGVFLLLVAIAGRAGGAPDPVPHGMVLTGLVVSVSTTAVALAIAVRTRALESRDDHGPRHDEPRT